MVWSMRTFFLAGLVSVVLTLALHAEQQSLEGSTSGSEGPHGSEQFAGVWLYNIDESVNAATGRPEINLRNETRRSPASRSEGARGGTAAGAGFGRVGDGGRGVGAGLVGPTVAMIQDNRSLVRDLMEVPVALTIKVVPSAVTFVDDLDRARTYPTTGLRQRYQIGAARFNATAEWNGSQLLKHIDAADGFRMTEMYFLSDDARRLFVIVRAGSTRKNAPVMGVNRVYDRASQ